MKKESNINLMNLPSGIPKPALRALEAAGIKNLIDLTRVSEEELLRLHGMGPKAVRIIAAALEAQGLCFTNKVNLDKISEKANQKIARRE